MNEITIVRNDLHIRPIVRRLKLAGGRGLDGSPARQTKTEVILFYLHFMRVPVTHTYVQLPTVSETPQECRAGPK